MPHIHTSIDYTVETFVVFKDKVLLRFHDKYGIWLSVGGHIEQNEDPNQAAIREVKEEVGLDIALYEELLPFNEKSSDYQELVPPFFMNIHRISDEHRHIALVYFAKADTDNVIESSEDRSGKWKWMTKAELEKATDIKTSIKFYALKALEKLSWQEPQ
jgi:8-oxo-dGTP pyrophosphatase MutT (NUDIX family)